MKESTSKRIFSKEKKKTGFNFHSRHYIRRSRKKNPKPKSNNRLSVRSRSFSTNATDVTQISTSSASNIFGRTTTDEYPTMALIENSYELLDEVGAKTPIDYETEKHLPPWFVREKLQHSQQVHRRYLNAVCFGHLAGLVILVFIRSILDTLKKTGKSKNLVNIFHRYFQTLLHVKLWYEGRIWDKKDEAYISLTMVKRMHQIVSNAQNKDKVIQKDQMAISKRDMTLTQFAFVAITVLHPEQIGFSTKQEDLESFIHFWAVIGYMLGIEDDYNLCLGDYQTVRQRCGILFDRNFRQSLMDYDQESARMAEQIVVTTNQFVWGLRFKSHLKLILEIFNVPPPPVARLDELNKPECFYYHQMRLILQHLYQYWLIAFIVNNLLRFSIYITQFRFRQKQIEHNIREQN